MHATSHRPDLALLARSRTIFGPPFKPVALNGVWQALGEASWRPLGGSRGFPLRLRAASWGLLRKPLARDASADLGGVQNLHDAVLRARLTLGTPLEHSLHRQREGRLLKVEAMVVAELPDVRVVPVVPWAEVVDEHHVLVLGWAPKGSLVHKLQDILVREVDQCVLGEEEICFGQRAVLQHVTLHEAHALQPKAALSLMLDEFVILRDDLWQEVNPDIVQLRPLHVPLPTRRPVSSAGLHDRLDVIVLSEPIDEEPDKGLSHLGPRPGSRQRARIPLATG